MAGQDVVDAAKNLTQGPIDMAQGAAGKVEDVASSAGNAVASAAQTVGDAANNAVTSVKDAITGDKTAPDGVATPTPQPAKPEEAPAWIHGDFSDLTSNTGIDEHFTNKMAEMEANAKKIGYIQNMPAASRAKYLADNGMSQNDIDSIQSELGTELKGQQKQAGEMSEEAGKTAKTEETEANELAPVAKGLMATAAIGMAPAVAAEGVMAAGAAGTEITAGLIAGQVAKTYAMFKIADVTTDVANGIVSQVFPNAGWKTHALTTLISGLTGFAAGGKLLNQVPWLKTAAADIPEVKAALDDNEHMMSEPVGIKHVEPEVMEGPPGASETAKRVGPTEMGEAQEPEQKGPTAIAPSNTPEGQAQIRENTVQQAMKETGVSRTEAEAALPKEPEKKESTPQTPEEQQVAALQKANLPVKLVSAYQQAERVTKDMISGKTVRDAGGKVDAETGEVTYGKQTPEQSAVASRNQRIFERGKLANELEIEENEPAVNKAINRRSNAPLTPEEESSFRDAHEQSINNIIKIANQHIQAMANPRLGYQTDLLGDLFTHESAKLSYLEKALGETPGTGNVVQDVAKTAAQSSDTLTTIAQQAGTPAVRAAKAAKIMGWQHYMDPANVAVSAALYNPKLILAKVMVDAAWAPYQNAIKGLSYVASLHPQDAISMWGASARGYLEGMTDFWRYGTKAFTTGERVGEKEMGMLNEPAKGGGTYAQDIDDSHPGMAVQGLQSTFNPETARKLKNAAGMVLNTGGRMILGTDQAAKTFAQRMAQQTTATAKAIEEANAQGIPFTARTAFIKARAADLMSLMPKDLFQQAKDEAMQLTFTSQNKLADRASRALDSLKIPATQYSPELHWGRMISSLFLRTPFNMFKQGAINTPLGAVMPESAGWGAGTNFASKRLAATKMAVGTGLLAALVQHFEGFNLTGDGPLDPSQAKMRKEMGIPDRSIGFTTPSGEQYYRSYEGLGPAATMLSLASNYAESIHSATPENKGAWADHATTALSRIVDHGPLMHQMGHILEALNSATRGDHKEMFGHLEDAAMESLKPEILTDIAKILDPTVKDAKTALQRLAEDNPWTRAGVPLKRDHFGYPQYIVPGHEASEIPPTAFETAMYIWNPFHTTPVLHPDPVEKEAMRVGAKLKDAPEMFVGGVGQPGVMHDSDSPKIGVPYSPDPVENARLKDRLQVLAGHEMLNNRGQNQHDAMLAEINSPRYQAMSQYRQADRLEGIADTFLWKAQHQLEKEDEAAHPDDNLKLRMRERFKEQRQEYKGSGAGAAIGAP